MAARRRNPALPAVAAQLTSFTPFPKLPTELRLQIYDLSIKQFGRGLPNSLVPLIWNARQRAFTTTRKPPPLLHTCEESRAQILKTYQLRFASSPDLARVYFSYEYDLLMLSWASLGSSPGRLARKFSDEDYMNVRNLMLGEETLLLHTNDNMRELRRFPRLKFILLVCDTDNLEWGEEYGSAKVARIAEELDKGCLDEDYNGTETWPEIVCCRTNDHLTPCSRHWWFEGWNQRAALKQKVNWVDALPRMLWATLEYDPEDAFFEMLSAMMDSESQSDGD